MRRGAAIDEDRSTTAVAREWVGLPARAVEPDPRLPTREIPRTRRFVASNHGVRTAPGPHKETTAAANAG